MKKLIIGAAMAVVAVAGFVMWQPDHTNHSLEKMARMKGDPKGPKPEFPGEYAQYLQSRRETPNNENPERLNYRYKDEIQASQLARGGLVSAPNLRFEDYGPGNFGGRIRGIVIDPADGDNIIVGGVTGGIWRTFDGGQSWANSDDFLPNLVISCLFMDPDNSDRIFAGTGEGFFGVGMMQGLGIFQSDDFGLTWTQLPSTDNSNFDWVNRIAMIPNTDIIIAATRAGLFRSTDLGANWTEVSGQAISSRGFVDVRVDPSNTDRLFAYHYGSGTTTRFLMRSTDAGANWTRLGAAEGMPTTNIGRGEIGIGSDGVVYVSMASSSDQTNGLYRSNDGGLTFQKTASTTPYIERQGWYDMMVGVDPSDSDRVFLGAVDVFRTEDAGTNIGMITRWTFQPPFGNTQTYVHADIHGIAFHPQDSNTVFIVCDGGLFKSTDSGDTWTSLNNDLRIAQYYGIATHPDGEGVIGGTQDNGSHYFFGNRAIWYEWFGGDGGFCAWDQQDTNYIYGSTPGGGMFGTSNEPADAASLNFPGGAGALFIQPFEIDPNDGNRMLVGSGSIWYTENLRQLTGANWTNTGAIGGSISATRFSPHDGSIAMVGSISGNLSRTTDLGTGNNWTSVNGPWNGDVLWIEFDPFDTTSNTVYVAIADFGPDKVWKTTDGGQNWTSIHGNLPEIPMNSITVDPTDGSRLFLGSDLGLWTTNDNANEGGAFTWEHYDYGVAWTRVIQLRWANDDVLWAATHGRGIIRITREPLEATLTGVDDSQSNCSEGGNLDGIIDRGETGLVSFQVTNTGGQPVADVTATLVSDSTDLEIQTATLNLGTLAAGASTTATFTTKLADDATCTGNINLTLNLGGAEPTSANFSITTAANETVQSGSLTEDAEGNTLYTHSALFDTDDWATVADPTDGGNNVWFTSNPGALSDKSLASPWMTADAGGQTITFDLYYHTEGDATQLWDGAMMEMRTEDQDWFDIGNLSTVPYDGPLLDNNTAPFRMVWSGDQRTWRSATVDLGQTYNGQRFQIRFRFVSDSNSNEQGFWVDDIAITNVSWVTDIACNATVCVSCFDTIEEALADIRTSAGSGEWPSQQTVLNYVDRLNNICE
ncbi:MAM domain-containing protein [Sulfidibacter corallicola]|uniref:MAM domain-containing protein n=1 Tax=Sulfidibacter corallicola TaxID=2818388 RepID=A0A8A4TLY8_SULCO|nr:hypothetical protein [Sulfidibacter corallicola]QTD50999.1 hypothetical protein J3U87_00890 [Sulfidibacter corallicola]